MYSVFVPTGKQKRAFHTILSGLKKSSYMHCNCRFLTLTTSSLMYNSSVFDYSTLNKSFRALRYRFIRMTPLKMVKQGYLSLSDVRRYYPEMRMTDHMRFQYVKVHTNEGYGVLHIVYRGSYCPYNWLVDNWFDIHLSWSVNIRLIKSDKKHNKRVAGYVVSQYVAGQGSSFVRMSQSWDWVFRGFKSLWYQIKRDYPNEFLSVWDKVLRSSALPVQSKLSSFL